jgi:hypothetical protein
MESLFFRIRAGLRLFARQWVRSAADAEDIVQEAFVNSGNVITSSRLISITTIVGALAAKPKFLPMPSNRSNRSFATDLPQPALLT